ncbi:DEAD domain containing protein [Amanita muscaria]
MADYIMTIDSDSEEQPKKQVRDEGQEQEESKFNPDFVFDTTGDPYVDVIDRHHTLNDLVKAGTKPDPISVNDIIARRSTLKKRKRQEDTHLDEESDQISERDEESSSSGDDSWATSDEEDDDVSHNTSDEEETEKESIDSSDELESDSQADKDRKAAYFDSESAPKQLHDSFLKMNLSRPIIKALTNLGFSKPTPIQASTIPVAMMGKDIVGNAVTGSGKTAAFMIPMLERLMYREKGKNAAATRCLILVPTRELGVQCYDVGTKLAMHTDIQFCLVVGGLSVKSQEVALRNRPDVVIATPGRLIDHLRNSPSFTLDALDILVLDEADRMLSDGFADELAEIIRSCPVSRQTMLFSATMTDSVDELVKMSLNKPVRLFVDPKRSTARGLVQEFVRVRAGREGERSPIVVALCKRTFKHRVIVFVRSKKLAHQLHVVFGLFGMQSEELHGNLTQEQRLRALQQFRDGSVDFLIATDLASRGLDIKGVETVINYDMPGQLEQYLHRVGRTARAGNKGRSVTLVGEADRKILKAAIKHAHDEDKIRHRVIPQEVVQKWTQKIEEMKNEISEILQEEKEEKQFRQAEMELKKGQNMIEHEEEIYSRPARTWFQSAKEKKKSEALSKRQYEEGLSAGLKGEKLKKDTGDNKPKRDKLSGLSRKAKRRKMAMEADKEFGDGHAIDAAIRSAKRSGRPSKIGVVDKRAISHRSKSHATVKGGSTFESDMGRRKGRKEVEGSKKKTGKKNRLR